ncbi:MAG: hypothetical protein ABIS86_17030 [Streptosporangiaceae bacterium]
MADDVRVTGQRELYELARRLRKQEDGKDRVKQLGAELRGAAKPLVPLIRGNIKGLRSKEESRRRGRRPLRASLSRAVTLQVKVSGSARKVNVAVFMNPRKMPDGTKAMPQYLEGVPGYLRLRHPLFGDRNHWYDQHTPAAGYFTRSTTGVGAQAESNVKNVIERTAREIEDG